MRNMFQLFLIPNIDLVSFYLFAPLKKIMTDHQDLADLHYEKCTPSGLIQFLATKEKGLLLSIEMADVLSNILANDPQGHDCILCYLLFMHSGVYLYLYFLVYQMRLLK